MFKLERKFTPNEFKNLQEILINTLSRKINQSNVLDWIDKLIDKYNGLISFGDRKWVGVELFYGTLDDLFNNKSFQPKHGSEAYKYYRDLLVLQFANEPKYFIFTHFHRNFKCYHLETMEYLCGNGINVGYGSMGRFVNELTLAFKENDEQVRLSRYVDSGDNKEDDVKNRKPFITTITIPVCPQDLYDYTMPKVLLFKGTRIPSRIEVIDAIRNYIGDVQSTSPVYRDILIDAIAEFQHTYDWIIPHNKPLDHTFYHHVISNRHNIDIFFGIIPTIYEIN